MTTQTNLENLTTLTNPYSTKHHPNFEASMIFVVDYDERKLFSKYELKAYQYTA